MGHADIQTAMIYVHHVPQNDAAGKLSRLLDARMSDEVGCEMDAKSPPDDEDENAESGEL